MILRQDSQCVSKKKYENDVIYTVGRAGLRGPLLRVTLGVLSPERRCRRRMNPGSLSGHAAVRCGHSAGEDLTTLRCESHIDRGGSDGVTHWTILLPLREI